MLRLIILFPHLSLLSIFHLFGHYHIKTFKIAKDNFNNILVKVKSDIQTMEES